MCVCKSFTTNMVVVIFTFGRLHLSSIVRKRTFREWNKSKTELHHVHCTVHRIQCLVVFQFICCFFFVVVQYADSVIEHNVSRKQRIKSYIETERKKNRINQQQIIQMKWNNQFYPRHRIQLNRNYLCRSGWIDADAK